MSGLYLYLSGNCEFLDPVVWENYSLPVTSSLVLQLFLVSLSSHFSIINYWVSILLQRKRTPTFEYGFRASPGWSGHPLILVLYLEHSMFFSYLFLRKINFKTAQIKSIPRKTKNSCFLLIHLNLWVEIMNTISENFSSYQIKNNRCTCFKTWRLCSHWRWIGWKPRRCWNADYLRRALWMLVWAFLVQIWAFLVHYHQLLL